MQTKTTFTLTDPEGFEIFVYKWTPEEDTPLKAVVQVAHGAAEHALRYERVARFLNEHGYIVYANDHRGHWKTAGSLDKAGKAGPDGWNGIVGDVHLLSDRIKSEHSDLPFFLFSHSMGSLIAQQYIENWGAELNGVILSGTFGSLGDNMAETIAMAENLAQAAPDESSPIFGQMFAGFNQPYAPGKTGFEWLSRDEAEVQKYADDPWCGFPFSNALVADFLKGGRDIWLPENEARIPVDLPMYVFSGAQDPAGANTLSVKALVERYRANGVQHIDVKFYPDARHETLNEINRDQVQRDLLAWLDKQVGA